MVIKFRGTDFQGNYRVGDLIHYRDGLAIRTVHSAPQVYEVDPRTVAQFCGFDNAGCEVYEGDELVDSDGVTYIAQIHRAIYDTDGGTFFYFDSQNRQTEGITAEELKLELKLP